MVLEERYDEYKTLYESIANQKERGDWRGAQILAAERMGFIDFSTEKERLLGMRVSTPIFTTTTPGELLREDEQRSVNIKDDLFEALNKSHKESLHSDAFVRPGSYIWYRLSQDNPEKFCTLVATHILKNEVGGKDPAGKSEAESQLDEAEDQSLANLERMMEERRART